jgi:ABC-type Fe3+/spermidine/putrescine transport system ATPase subunit
VATRVGDRVLLMLRPEMMQLTLADQAPAQGFSARLASIDFQGSLFRYELEREDGQHLVVTLLPQHKLAGASEGQRVAVDWDMDLAWVVPAEAPNN